MPSPFARAVETVAPARLGRSFRWLLAASTLTNIGDGVALAAGPLLVASLTQDPLLVSLTLLSQTLPPLLFGLFAGVVADRHDRRRIVAVVNVVRAVVLGLLATTIVSDTASIAIVLGALFILATAETFADVGEQQPPSPARAARGPGHRERPALGRDPADQPARGPAHRRRAVRRRHGAAVRDRRGLLRPRRDPRAHGSRTEPAEERPGGRSTIRADLVEGLRWLLSHPAMRTLALTIVAFNITFGAAWSVLVLYAGERLGMTAVGFGLLTTAIAIGGIIGTGAYGRLERRFSLADIMRGGLIIETLTHLVLALTTLPVVALATFVVFGAHELVWGTTATAIRQRAVPDAVLGRVTGVYTVGIYLGIVIGTPIGGLLARTYGLTAPFWFGFIGSAVLVVVLWRQFDNIAHAGAVAAPAFMT